MPAFTTREVSPLDLILDTKNPRFILPKENSAETDIIKYLLNEENVETLCKNLNAVGTILPGERIVICDEDNQQVVLEGNRRVCCCKLLLDRKLIPSGHKIPVISQETYDNIKKINVDVVASRKVAMKYLAARHISGVDKWSTLAKMNYVNREFEAGRSVNEIHDMSSLEKGAINKYLRQGNLLRVGIENGHWTKFEKRTLALDKLEPDPYFRVLGVKGTRDLQIKYDDKFIPHSNYIVDQDLYDILTLLIKGAFIDKAYNTRTDYFDSEIQDLIKPILGKYRVKQDTELPKEESTTPQNNPYPLTTTDRTQHQHESGHQPTNPTPESEPSPEEEHKPKQKPIKTSPLFAALDCNNVDIYNQNYQGVLRICKEAVTFSKLSSVKNYSICSTLLTRSILENTTIAFIKKRGYWDNFVKRNGGNESKIHLSTIIKYMTTDAAAANFFPKADMRARFKQLFSDYDKTANRMNWVVHQLNSYLMPFDTLQAILDEGLFEIIQYMIHEL